MRLWSLIEGKVPALKKLFYMQDASDEESSKYRLDWSALVVLTFITSIVNLVIISTLYLGDFMGIVVATVVFIVGMAIFVALLTLSVPSAFASKATLSGIFAGVFIVVTTIFSLFSIISCLFNFMTRGITNQNIYWNILSAVSAVIALLMNIVTLCFNVGTGAWGLYASFFAKKRPALWDFKLTPRLILALAILMIVPALAELAGMDKGDSFNRMLEETYVDILVLAAMFILLVVVGVAATFLKDLDKLPVTITDIVAFLGLGLYLGSATCRLISVFTNGDADYQSDDSDLGIFATISHMLATAASYILEAVATSLIIDTIPKHLQVVFMTVAALAFFVMPDSLSNVYRYALLGDGITGNKLARTISLGMLHYTAVIAAFVALFFIDVNHDRDISSDADKAALNANNLRYPKFIKPTVKNGIKTFPTGGAGSVIYWSVILAAVGHVCTKYPAHFVLQSLQTQATDAQLIYNPTVPFESVSSMGTTVTLTMIPIIAVLGTAFFGVTSAALVSVIAIIVEFVVLGGMVAAPFLASSTGFSIGIQAHLLGLAVALNRFAVALLAGVTLSCMRVFVKHSLEAMLIFFTVACFARVISTAHVLVHSLLDWETSSDFISVLVLFIGAGATIVPAAAVLVHPFFYVGRNGYVSVGVKLLNNASSAEDVTDKQQLLSK
ncbi:hypothetical protein J8273_2145 [Carpediemonas membranifera]|uniref:Uncharacterized protein n=1 Tax=Carpediemonas membranifera TaxID=201153 RepID=A0A8J6E1I9_9EUKA|nr:hypothetical protein J8273_2145 [Carpediemonas membranifera]|eukprot:KAG9396414.1 hypothetical protein J8273_2145 [Carpediemonas membranifera]